MKWVKLVVQFILQLSYDWGVIHHLFLTHSCTHNHSLTPCICTFAHVHAYTHTYTYTIRDLKRSMRQKETPRYRHPTEIPKNPDRQASRPISYLPMKSSLLRTSLSHTVSSKSWLWSSKRWKSNCSSHFGVSVCISTLLLYFSLPSLRNWGAKKNKKTK